MRSIRIAHVVKDLGYAGKEAGIVKITSHLDRSRFSVDIVVLNKVYRKQQVETDAFRTIAIRQKRGNDPRVFLKLARVFAENRHDIVYTHSWNTLLEGFFAAKLARVPALIHGEHGTFEHSWLKDRLQPAIWKQFDVVTVVSADLRKRMAQQFRYENENVRVLLNGIDRRRFFPSPGLRQEFREKHSLTDHYVIGTVGRFHPVKDQLTLIRGFSAFLQVAPEINAKLVLAGPATHQPTYESCLQLIQELGLEDRTVILPATEEIAPIYNAMDTFVLSSISEGCSNVLLEAMACGVPVVATETGGIPELVTHGKNGLLFPVGDAAALGRCLHSLYRDNALRSSLIDAAQQRIATDFTLEKTVKGYEQIYETLYQSKCEPKSTQKRTSEAQV